MTRDEDNVIKVLLGGRGLAGGSQQSAGAELPREPRPLQRPPGRGQGRGGGVVLDIRYTALFSVLNKFVVYATTFDISF